MVALNVKCSMFNGELLLQLPRCSAATVAAIVVAASGGALVIVGHGVLVRLCLGGPRQLCTTDGSSDVVASLVVHFRLHVLEAQVLRVGVPATIYGWVQLAQNSQIDDVTLLDVLDV